VRHVDARFFCHYFTVINPELLGIPLTVMNTG
jgi:hypothetical protein